MEHLIHRITQLPCKGDDTMYISEGKGSDLAIVEAMKKKYKVENNMQGSPISSINEKAVRMATQILESKVMRMCHADEVPVLVVTLAE